MAKRLLTLLPAAVLLAGLFCGCHRTDAEVPSASDAQLETAGETVAATIPADGDPEDVTCKGSYSGIGADADTVVARAADAELTNGELQVWYWLAAADWAGSEDGPDFSRPLDTQSCSVDSSVNSWQQYFLKQALNSWHSACALELQSREEPLPTEEAYQPSLENYETYMTGMPATEYLYGYNPLYEPNSMHEAYLTALPETLEELAKQKGYSSLEELASAGFGTDAETLQETVRLYNFSYMYFTTLSYYVEVGEEAVLSAVDPSAEESRAVDIRHILLIPEDTEEFPVTVAEDGTVTCAEEAWEACTKKAEELLQYWRYKTKHTGPSFSELAVQNSQDTGSALNGGIYLGLHPGELTEALDAWCFAEERQSGDTGIVRSPYGIHLLYFTGTADEAYGAAESSLKAQAMARLIADARSRYPAEIDYSAISLTEGAAGVSADDILYADIAHERFPEVPLYLQQDYPTTKYGAYWIRGHGCGITTLAMLASYMSDDELTPPELCAIYGSYSHRSGTDGMIFIYEPSSMGFYLRKKTYDVKEAYAALEEGQIVISVQHKGYWTRGGHYIVLEKLLEDGRIQVRDSNIYNYFRISSHAEDSHTWGSITAASAGYWIYEDKITRIPACCRCGSESERISGLLNVEYLCEKCTPALLRRNTYLSACTADG